MSMTVQMHVREHMKDAFNIQMRDTPASAFVLTAGHRMPEFAYAKHKRQGRQFGSAVQAMIDSPTIRVDRLF
jgi:hypothetical protein